MQLLWFLLLVCAASQVSPARILGITSGPSYSHYNTFKVLLDALADKGHDVTVVGFYEAKNPKMKSVYLTGYVAGSKDGMPKLDELGKQKMSFIQELVILHHMGLKAVNHTLEHPKFKEILDQEYDVVLLELFMNEALRGACHHFKAPCVLVSLVEATHWVNIPTGNPQHPSYMPQMATAYVGGMNFWQRLYNTVVDLAGQLSYHFLVLPAQDALMRKVFPSAPPLKELIHAPSLVFVNSHPSTSQVIPSLPSVLQIGGYHVKPPKALPKDLQVYLDNAKEGVVYFSMGSMLRSTDFSAEKRAAVLGALSKIPLKVLWKFEDENLPGKPANVKVSKWLPQSDILAHPNVKLFISHGGLMGTIEATTRGVPVLGIPIYGDQSTNIKRAVHSGYAVGLDYADLTEESLLQALKEVLGNPRYTENAKRIAGLMQDAPMKPMDTAVYWVEYAIRNPNLDHLRPLSLDLCWYQYYLLDVILFVVCLLAGTVWVTKWSLCKLLKRKVSSKGKKND